MKKIKGVIYDLDGTIISTQKIHEDAWVYSAGKIGISLTEEMLLDQRGVSNEESALKMLPEGKKHLLEEFIKIKNDYVENNINKIIIFPNIVDTMNDLVKDNIKVSICTSAKEDFVSHVLKRFPSLKEYNIVWRELYKEEKPLPESLELTTGRMGLMNKEVLYVGDALNDYRTSINAKIDFIYFCPNESVKDYRIPNDIHLISDHKEIFTFLNRF
jgi:phosphoglycolate phosphatase-like HAD superfamily hydrolase